MKNKQRADETKSILKKWTDNSDKGRNGLLHKEIITVKNRKQLKMSIIDAFVAFFNIVYMFKGDCVPNNLYKDSGTDDDIIKALKEAGFKF